MIVTIALAGLLVLGTEQQGAPAVDPCSLITRAEAEAVVGKLKAEPKSMQEERARTCEYAAAGDASIEIWLFPETGLKRAQDSYKDLKPLAGLEQPAFIRTNRDIDWIELYTKKGAVTLEVTMRSGPGAEEKVKGLAAKALARLK